MYKNGQIETNSEVRKKPLASMKVEENSFDPRRAPCCLSKNKTILSTKQN